MKIALFSFLAALGILLAGPSAAQAQAPTFDYGNNANWPAGVTQLFADLETITAGSTVTDAQHAALVADLTALTTTAFTPSAADLDQIATDLGTAATGGLLPENVLEYLGDDFVGDPDVTDDPDGWLADIQDDLASLLNPLVPVVGDPTADPVMPIDTGIYETLTRARAASGTYTRQTFLLNAQGIPPFLLENYSGRARLTVSNSAGVAPVINFSVQTRGLPPSNPYMVMITRRSDGASVALGSMQVRSFHTPLSSGSVITFAHGTFVAPQAEFATTGHVTFGTAGAKNALPPGFDAADISAVTLTDAQGVVRLAASVTDGQSLNQTKELTLRLDGNAVAAGSIPTGSVSARHTSTEILVSNRFRLSARHLPASAPVNLVADGTSLGQFTTTAKGRLMVVEGFTPPKVDSAGAPRLFQRLPARADLSGVKSFSLTDAQGNVLLHGSLD